MAGQAGKWRYGLLPLAALWLGVNTLETPRIEAELKERAQRALDALGAVGAHPHVEGRDVTLKGEIADSARAAAVASVAATGGRVAADALSALPAPKPEVAAARPDKPASAMTEPKTVDAPPAAKPLPPKPAEKTAPAADAIAHPVAAPYLFHVEKFGDKVALSGFYPDEDAHSKIVAAAAKAFSGRELVDQLKPAGGAPSGFLDAALAGLAQLARLRSGALDLHDCSVRLSGEAGGAEAADDIRARLEGVRHSGYSVTARIAGPPAKIAAAAPRVAPPVAPPVDRTARSARLDARACQARMAALVKDAPIVFPLRSALLDPESARTLDAVAEEAKRCPDVDFEIAGHSDDIGLVSANLELSRRRAESVLVYLVAVGVAPHRLTAVGYGETRPLVANVNDANRARNRRIEFNLK